MNLPLLKNMRREVTEQCRNGIKRIENLRRDPKDVHIACRNAVLNAEFATVQQISFGGMTMVKAG
jgi:hypothetical protein